MKKRSGFTVMVRLAGLVKPLAGFMVLAIAMGLAGHLCASFLTIFGAYGVLEVLGPGAPLSLPALFAAMVIFALLRGALRYGEQTCNHYIAFKLLALIRDKVFRALRRLCPAKLEGRDKGDLIAVITSDIELLEVFYAHTISPIAIAVDSLNEAVILRSLREERQGKTVVLVSHRASTMWVTDTVWSVENGRMS